MSPIAQHFIGGFNGTKVTPIVKKLVQKHNIGGIIIFSRNFESIRQLTQLIRKLKHLAKSPLLVGVDQEGGSVARLGSPFTQLPPMAKLGKYYQKTKDTRAIKQVGCLLGRELRAVGFNWDFAPVVDVHSNPKNPVIGQRAFDPNPRVVTLCAAALIKGLHEEGVLSCAKHFPGHGATSVDSHKDLPILRSAGRLLWKRDVFPYRKLMEKRCLPCIMTAHVRYTELDSHSCATLSELIITGILRKRMGYRGLVVSDDFQMKAIADRYDLSEAAFKFFMAGGDMAMLCFWTSFLTMGVTLVPLKPPIKCWAMGDM